MTDTLNPRDRMSAEAESASVDVSSALGQAAPQDTAEQQGLGCHAGKEKLKAAAMKAGKSEVLEQYAKDYPVDAERGPHDQPQSMCPAFGSLRVGLRMRRTATILSGSACCVYGLTFTSHFYGARRTVGYVPFDSESLVTGKLYEDIRDAVHEIADPEKYDAVVVTNLCVPTASGVPLQMLPKQINGVRIIGIDVPGFGVPTHAEAKDILAAAMLNYARQAATAGPVQAPESRAGGDSGSGKPKITLVGEMFPVDPISIGQMLAPLDLEAGTVVPTREWRELYSALDCSAVAAIHPFYTASFREFEAAGRPITGSAPVGVEGTDAWLKAIGELCNVKPEKVDAARNALRPAIQGALGAAPIKARVTLSGYEGSELLVARLLVESGADVRYVGSACPKTQWSAPDLEWLEAHGVQVRYRASLEDDLADIEEFEPDLAIGTTPVVQKAKEAGTPSLYFTNLISARPLMGPAGAGSLSQVINAALKNKSRFDAMKSFFDGVGTDYAAGVWEETPEDRPSFKKKFAARAARSTNAVESGGAIGT